MIDSIDPLAALLRGSWWRNIQLPAEMTDARRLESALQSLDRRFPDPGTDVSDEETPVFVLSAGWGSGSTLLQRLVVSTGDCLIWGEPFDHAAPVHRLSQFIAPVDDRWPRDKYFEIPAKASDLRNSWIANLTPQPEHLRAALRETLIRWLKVPATASGYRYWGLKEVRLTIHHALFLRWLFPNARFLFTYRDVLNSYRSIKGVKWFSIWPHYRVRNASHFAHHWKLLLEGFLDGHRRIGGLLIPYEDLVAGRIDLGEISDYLGMGPIDAGVLSRKVGARSKDRPQLSFRERYVINSITGPLRERCGYTNAA